MEEEEEEEEKNKKNEKKESPHVYIANTDKDCDLVTIQTHPPTREDAP
jgi:hypothetical protein